MEQVDKYIDIWKEHLKNRQQGRQLKETDNKRNQGPISPTFNEQLLHAQFPKVHKDTADLTTFLRFWDLCT